MVILFTDDFENGLSKWVLSGTPSTQTLIKRSGSYALVCNFTDVAYAVFTADLPTIYVRPYVYFETLPPDSQVILSASSSDWTEIATVYVNPIGEIYIQAPGIDTMVGSVTAATWVCLELRVTKGTGADGIVEVWKDGVLIFSATNLPLVKGIFRVALTGQSGVSHPVYFDDVIIAEEYIEPDYTPPPTGTIAVSATQNGLPVAASVSVGGQTGTTPTIFTLPVGSYTVSATYGGTTLTQGATVVSQGQTIVVFTFTTGNEGYLSVSAYAGATQIAANVTADGQSGVTPVTFTFPAGTYSITASYQGTILPAQTATITAGQTTAVVLQFAPSLVATVNVVAGLGGSVSPAGTQQLTIGTSYQFIATPSTGYDFDYWDLAGVNVGSSLSLTLTATADMDGQTLTAVFKIKPTPTQITMNAVAGIGGTLAPSGQLNLTVGSAYQFTASPDVGYDFNYWDLAGANKGSSPSIILQITADMDGQTLTAVFTTEPPPKVTMMLAVIGDGSTDMAPGQYQFNVGDTITITAITQAGQTFLRWTVGANSYMTNPLVLPITQDMAGQTITAEFVTLIQGGFPLWVLIPVGIISVGAFYALKGDKHRKK